MKFFTEVRKHLLQLSSFSSFASYLSDSCDRISVSIHQSSVRNSVDQSILEKAGEQVQKDQIKAKCSSRKVVLTPFGKVPQQISD